MAEIENLTISITASANSAVDALDHLASAFQRVKSAVKGFNALDVVNSMNQIERSALGAASALNRFAAAQERINRATAGFQGASVAANMVRVARNTESATTAMTTFASALANVQMIIRRMNFPGGSGIRGFLGGGSVPDSGPIETFFTDVEEGMESARAGTQSASFSIMDFLRHIRDTVANSRVTAAALSGISTAFRSIRGAVRGALGMVAGFFRSIARIAYYRMIRAILKDMVQSFKDLYGWSKAFGTDFYKSMDTVNTAFVYLRNSIAAMAAPLVNALAPVLDVIVDKIVDVLNWFNQLFAALSGAKTYTVAKKVGKTWESSFDSTGKSASKTKKKVDDLKRTLLGFDEINKLNSQNTSSSGSGSKSGSSPYSGGYKYMFEEKPVTGGFKDVGDSLSKWVSTEIGKINAIIDASAFALGLILATHGAPGIGIGMMIAGALDAGASVVAYSDKISPQIKAAIAGILGIVGIGMAVGAVLAFTGGHIGLGIGLMAASIGALSGSYKIVKVNWDSISKLLQGPIGTITTLVSGALLAVGAVLAFSNANIPLGIGMMAAGAVGLATTITANWNTITEKLRGPLGAVTALVSGASLALGIIALVGGNIPLGIGLILAGAAGLASTVAANWDNIKNMGKTAFKKLKEGWDSLAQKALELKAAIVTKAKELWDNLSAAWSNLRGKVVTFAAKVANDARTWWGNIQAWWSETKNKVVNFAAKVVNDAKTWWGNVSAWWSETKNKIVAFAAQVINDAKTWWGNVSAWWSETKNKIVSFAAQIVNDAKTWWGNVSAWWSEIKDKVVSFAAKVVNDAKTWWSNVSAWWSETKDKVVSFAAEIANNAATWWSNVKTWWSNTTTGKTVKEFVTEVKDKSATWWKNVVSWWKGAVNSTSIKEVSISILNEAAIWWNNVVTWWKEMTSGKWLGIKILPSLSGESADMEEYAKTGGQYTQAWFDEHIKPLEDKARDTTLEVNVDANPTWENSWWGRMFGGGDGLLSYLGIDNLSTEVLVGVGTVWNWASSLLDYLNIDSGDLDTTVNIHTQTAWEYFGQSILQYLHLDDLATTVKVGLKASGSGVKLAASGRGGGTSWKLVPQADGGIITALGQMLSFAGGGIINAYANGTTNTHGTMFLAGEAGPEIVGHVGGRTEVLNKSQLAATMYQAVNSAMKGVTLDAHFYGSGMDSGNDEALVDMMRQNVSATERQNELLRQQNEYLRQLNEKDTTVEISANSIARGLNRQNRRAGTTVVPVGT